MTTSTAAFPGTLLAPRQARAWAAPLLDGCPAAADVILALSEFVTNSVRHSASAADASMVRVRLVVAAGVWVRCEVRDAGPQPAGFRDRARADGGDCAVTEPDPGGWGLDVVSTLAHGQFGSDGAGLAWFVIPWRPGAVSRPSVSPALKAAHG